MPLDLQVAPLLERREGLFQRVAGQLAFLDLGLDPRPDNDTASGFKRLGDEHVKQGRGHGGALDHSAELHRKLAETELS
jgi:hypothetical protein